MTCFDDRWMRDALVRHEIRLPPMAIQRADVARFVLLHERGGMYIDADVQPIHGTLVYPESFLDSTGVVFGYEAIVNEAERRRYGIYRSKSLCMWTVFALPRSPILLSLARNLSDNAVLRSSTRWTTKNELVHKTTGPTAVTDFILPRVSVVAPVVSFGCGQEHSNARMCLRKHSFCKHGFAGTWRQPGTKSPPRLSVNGVGAALLSAVALYITVKNAFRSMLDRGF